MSQEIEVRRLNEMGISRFSNVDWGSTGSAGDPPREILLNDDYSEIVTFSNGRTRLIDGDTSFEKYSELVDIIDGCLGPAMDLSEVAEDRGLWSWFSLLFYNSLRSGEPGSWKEAAMPRFIPSGKSNSYYRHQVFSPYALTKMHGKEASAVFLCGKTNVWPEVNEQLLNVAAFVSSTPLISAASLLYFDQGTKKAKKYAASKDGEGLYNGGGSARRLRTVFWQLYETYDLRSMTADQIVQLLPSEFDPFRNGGDDE